MNLHAPQSYEAATELEEIAAVPHQILRPRDGIPVIGIVQDTLVGSYRLTRDHVQFNRREYMNLMMWNKRFDGTIPQPKSEEGKWTGRQILSQLMPPINLEMMNSGKKKVVIREGEVLEGQFDKSIYSKASRGIIHMTYKDYGIKETVDMIDALQNTVEQFLVFNGFSVGISDLIADELTKDEMNNKIQEKKSDVETILLQIHQDLFDNNTGKSNQQEFEDKVFGTLNKALDLAGNAGQASLANENRMTAMVRAGSKGGPINIAQMIACVGQQNIEGKRIPNGFEDRTLPHFKKFDDGAEARGFIENSFISGLTPTEFFFHAMSGREGLIDTAVKSVTGDTEIVVMEDGLTKKVRIGDWIDTHLADRAAAVEHFPEEADLEMIQLEKDTFIPSVTPDGKISWGKVAAVTRHDPGDRLYRVETLGGRSVIVTAAKSLLVWNSESKLFENKNTPDVRPGDCMPVTMNLPEAPVATQSIPLAQYLPKTEYLYGSDFHVAQCEVEAAMVDREHVPAGWWTEKNGKVFTLPYENKGRFVRTLSRSKLENIQPGYVYPFTTNRSGARLPDTFALNETNGVFLGLFLAEGNVDVRSGTVAITNNSPEVRQFVHDWFENLRIKCSEEVRLNAIGGVTTTVRGYSTVLAKFLDELCSHGASAKCVPAEAFTAPLEFVKGVLNGYISGDGTVTRNSVEAGSASKALTEGVVMLLSRIGVFAKMFETQLASNNLGTENIQPSYRWSVRAQWAHKLADMISLLDAQKEEKLVAMEPSDVHRNFPFQNDCVLDEITSIEPISPDAYPKMYDLTVPETFTFGLANGLQVYDTADTGYIQRQLVKAMEDLTTQHDGTVRDANGNITQFHYGEDGINSTKIEALALDLGEMTDEQLAEEFELKGVDLTPILGEGIDRGDDAEALKTLAEQVKADRKMMVEGVFRSGKQGGIFAAVNLERLLLNIKAKFGLTPDVRTNLTPARVIAGINAVLDKTQRFHKIWAALLRFYLSPAKIIVRERFTESAFDTLCEMLVTKNWQAWVQPGELVGIIAAQSIGEPSTQMSCVKDTIIHIVDPSGNHYVGPIGSFVDKLLETGSTKSLGEDSIVMDLEKMYKIVSVSRDEKTAWARISQISRHPANGGLVKITTRSGRSTTATLSHSFLRRSSDGIVPVLGSDLKVGMRIPVARGTVWEIPSTTSISLGSQKVVLNRDFGWLCGMYLADGSFNGNSVQISKINPVVEETIKHICSIYNWTFTTTMRKCEYGESKTNSIYNKELKQFLSAIFNTGSYKKTISQEVYGFPKEYIEGLLGGYMDGDGNVSPNRQQIRAGSRSRTLIRHIARLFSACGFFTTFGTETSARIPGKVMYTLNVLRKDAHKFKKDIGLRIPEKATALDILIAYMEREEKHDTKEMYDKIPEIGDILAETGRLLKMPGQSRTYGRWMKKESIGRLTLLTYLDDFQQQFTTLKDIMTIEEIKRVEELLVIITSAAESSVVWDEIVEVEILEDPQEYVYDFTVPGNESFKVDDDIMVHNTLNTFHLAGVASKSNVTRGVPRLKELLKVTQNPKAVSLTIPLKAEYANNKIKAREVAQELELTLLRDMTIKTAIYYDPKDDETILKEDREILAFYKLFELQEQGGQWSKYILRLELNRQNMFDKNITMDDINYVLRERFGDEVNVIYSDFNSQKLVMRLRLSTDSIKEASKGDPSSLDMMSIYKKFQNKLLNSVIIRGLPGIKAATFRKGDQRFVFNEKEGKYEAHEEYILDTDGSNFLEVMNHPAVDASRVYSTHVHDIYNQLGIEATRAVLYNEIQTLFEDGTVNYRHLGLLVDVMCRAGRLMSVDRYGINKLDIGPLAKASFEETERILLKAAVFGEMDPITGVSANIMTGQPIRGGTAFSDILLDEVAVMRLQKGLPPAAPLDQEEDAPTEEQIEAQLTTDPADICSANRLRLNINLPKAKTLIEDEPDVDIMVLDGE